MWSRQMNCSRCLMCGCDRDDHFEPDPYDMGNAELDAAGHLNHCGDCAQCFGPEFNTAGGEAAMTTGHLHKHDFYLEKWLSRKGARSVRALVSCSCGSAETVGWEHDPPEERTHDELAALFVAAGRVVEADRQRREVKP